MSSNRKRMTPEERKKHILNAAVNLAQLDGYTSLTRDAVARVAVVSPGLVTAYFWTTVELRKAVMTEAIRLGIHGIIAEGIATRCPIALAAPVELRVAAIAGLSAGAASAGAGGGSV
jgi:DNA-binding transcriptional regulator YbjK